MPRVTPALIATFGPGRPDNSLPGFPGLPDNSLPGFPGYPDNSLPPGFPGRPDNSLPPMPGVWPPRPVVWPPIPPIEIEADPDIGISLPIVLPGSPDNSLPPVPVEPVRPSNPIVLPPMPEGNVVMALVLRIPGAPKDADGSTPGLLWYGPGTLPVIVDLPPPGVPK